MNILFIGSSGALSLAPFKQLLQSPYSVVAVGVDRPLLFDSKLIAIENESLALAANQYDIPLIDLSQAVDEVIATCLLLSVDLILMSCYGRRLPDEIIRSASYGCYNCHPSLLPRYRGPEPIFWQIKDAVTLGVSWHQVVHDFDAGDVINQRQVQVDDGASYSEIAERLALTAADLLLELLSAISGGHMSAIPQDEDVATYYPYPKADDFTIDTNWPARRAYNFMCATQAFGCNYRCQIDDHAFQLVEALDFDNNSILDAAEVQGERLFIPCAEGVLIARHTDKIRV